MEPESVKYIAKAIIVVGLAAISVWSHIKTNGLSGEGWGILAFLVLIFM